MRKWILRQVARKAGLPESLTWRRKKAIQHSTGVENAIKKLAKAQRLTPDDYLKRDHESVLNMEQMP